MNRIKRTDFADLSVFLAVVRCRSFSTAAIELGLTASAVSHAIRRLETRVGTQLLSRTNRSVAPTHRGLRLAEMLDEGFGQISAALQELDIPGIANLAEMRITVSSDTAYLLIAPVLPAFASRHPQVRLTIVVENRPVDIIAEGYDAGIRFGHHVPEGMIAVPLTQPSRWVMAASPKYIKAYGRPSNIDDLDNHNCLQLLLGDNSSFRWELYDQGVTRKIKTPGGLTINDTATTISAAKQGIGIAYLHEARIASELDGGDLELVLEQYACPEEPFYIYYPNRHAGHPALRALVDQIRTDNQLPPLR